MAIQHAQFGAYVASLGDEILSQMNRVRHLIGNRHWQSDGHHKEYLLNHVLRRHIPAGCEVSRGFVVDPRAAAACSREQDLLVVDTSREAPLFNQGGLCIALPQSVLACVSVKTSLEKRSVDDAVEGLDSVKTLMSEANIDPSDVWCGAYFCELAESVRKRPEKVLEYVQEAIEQRRPHVLPDADALPGLDMLCDASEVAVRVRRGTSAQEAPRVLGYSCDGLATSVLVSSLISHVSACRSGQPAHFSDLMRRPEIKRIGPEEGIELTWD